MHPHSLLCPQETLPLPRGNTPWRADHSTCLKAHAGPGREHSGYTTLMPGAQRSQVQFLTIQVGARQCHCKKKKKKKTTEHSVSPGLWSPQTAEGLHKPPLDSSLMGPEVILMWSTGAETSSSAEARRHGCLKMPLCILNFEPCQCTYSQSQ